MAGTYLGIDPGVTGAFALLQVGDDGVETLTVTATPVVWRLVNDRKRRVYDIGALLELLRALPAPIGLAYLEDQSARPGQGVSSTFSTGYGFGLWSAVLVALTIPHIHVTPTRWRRDAGLPGSPRGTSKKAIKMGVWLRAKGRFPGNLIRQDHADAVMIAVACAGGRHLPREPLPPPEAPA